MYILAFCFSFALTASAASYKKFTSTEVPKISIEVEYNNSIGYIGDIYVNDGDVSSLTSVVENPYKSVKKNRLKVVLKNSNFILLSIPWPFHRGTMGPKIFFNKQVKKLDFEFDSD